MKKILSFRAGNAGLGIHDAYHSVDSNSDDGGRVMLCPLCFAGPNDESHLLFHCLKMRAIRLRINVSGGVSLEESLRILHVTPDPAWENETVRRFQGQSGPTYMVLVERGLALDILLEEFFPLWTKQSRQA